MSADSRVLDALMSASNLETVLRALGCDTSKDNHARFDSPHGYIHCPMPDHADRNPSCSVVAEAGLLVCRSACETIRPLDLVVAHGRARDRGEAAKWIEDLLGIDTRAGSDPRIVIDDPSLSVAQYLALKNLSAQTRERFDLRDVRTWLSTSQPAKGYRYAFDEGWHGGVLMPADAPGTALADMQRRPRVRTETGIRWAATIDSPLSGEKVSFNRANPKNPSAELAHIQGAYGVAQFRAEPADSMLHRTIVVVEGESDVHALHDMGIACCLGIPGATNVRGSIGDVIGTILECEGGDTAALQHWNLLVWSEPGDAGEKFPQRVAEHALTWCDAMTDGMLAPVPPRVVALPHDRIVLEAGAGPAQHAKDPCELVSVVAQRGALALDTARARAGDLFRRAAFVSLGATPADLDPAAPAAAVEPGAAQLPAPGSMQIGDDVWTAMRGEGSLPCPPREQVPTTIMALDAMFQRTADGWQHVGVNAKGDPFERPICSIVYVQGVEELDDEQYLSLRAPDATGSQLLEARVPRADLADPRAASKALAGIGVMVAMRQGPAVCLLLHALADHWVRTAGGVDRLTTTTGWSGVPGSSPFGGIEVEPAVKPGRPEFGRLMFLANQRRRERQPDTQRAAREWWDAVVEPLIAPLEGADPAAAAAPMLTIGAAAAAPLVGPLADMGVAVAPVVWLAGLGGGGKTITQKVCASIFAPSLANLDGQAAFFSSANISAAALNARVDLCRDLPLILDDVGQLPPASGSTSKGDAARIEAAADLGMMVFNRKPIERATREGGIRMSRPFRSTAIFSAEVSMRDVEKAQVKAGHRRRITTIEARPMADRGLGQPYAQLVNDMSASHGGAAGELHVAHIRELHRTRALDEPLKKCQRRVRELARGVDVTGTQIESLAADLLGFVLLAHVAGGKTIDDALDIAASLLGPFVQGAATRDGELAGVDTALSAVSELVAANPHRFSSDLIEEEFSTSLPPSMGYLGKILKTRHDGSRVVVLTRSGMSLLESQHGVNAQTIAQAIADGVCKRRHTIRLAGKVMAGTRWILPPAGTDDPDDDPSAPAPHDPDPHRLAQPAPVAEPDPELDRILAGGAPEITPAPGYLYDALGTDLDEFAPAPREPLKMGAEHLDLVAGTMTRPVPGSEYEHRITWIEWDYIMDARFQWATGLYLVGDAESMRRNPSLLKTIRGEAVEELGALRELFEGSGVVVADMPDDSDEEKWSKIDGLGRERALGLWAKARDAHTAATQAAHSSDAVAELEAKAAYVKAYRIGLMARYRRPEWFVVDA